MVTLAPELPGGRRPIRLLAAAGVVAAVGHTDGSYAVAAQAFDAGARVATHLFNAMRPSTTATRTRSSRFSRTRGSPSSSSPTARTSTPPPTGS